MSDKPRCPECSGKTIEFRGVGRDLQYKICSCWIADGHLTESEIRQRIQERREAEIPRAFPSGRQA